MLRVSQRRAYTCSRSCRVLRYSAPEGKMFQQPNIAFPVAPQLSLTLISTKTDYNVGALLPPDRNLLNVKGRIHRYYFNVSRATAQFFIAVAYLFSWFFLRGTQEACRYNTAHARGPLDICGTCNRHRKSPQLALFLGEALRSRKAVAKKKHLFA